MTKRTKFLLTAIVVAVIMGIFGRIEHDDMVRQRAEYCANVRDGVWPDYARVYATECPQQGGRHVPATARP